MKLKDFIADIRACKTAADERSVIAKESASIRTQLKEENTAARHSNVAKLLYIHMLGYPAHFGQMECVKLIASQRFSDKKLGYLGVMLLLDETQGLLTLVTNALKNDLNHSNPQYVSLALSALGSIVTMEMGHDLSSDLDRLMGSSNGLIRKKANICAWKIIRKIPDLHEIFNLKCKSGVLEKNNGPLHTNLVLMQELSLYDVGYFEPCVPELIRHLKILQNGGSEHEISGIGDPFLQVKILQVIQVLKQESDELNQILAQIATNTDTSKNVGCAIVYEAVKTILKIRVDPSLRVLAINILGKFLSNKDNNIRYIALQNLLETVHLDSNAVQRHRAIVLQCLHDSDPSIRKRALELSFGLFNTTTVRLLTRELLGFLEISDVELRPFICSKLFDCAELYAPNKRWHIDTLLQILKIAASHTTQQHFSKFCLLVSQSSLQSYAGSRLYSLCSDLSQTNLVNACVYVLGEYAQFILNQEDKITEFDALNLCCDVLKYKSKLYTKKLTLTCLFKLNSKYPSLNEKIQTLFSVYAKDVELSLQMKALCFQSSSGLKLNDYDKEYISYDSHFLISLCPVRGNMETIIQGVLIAKEHLISDLSLLVAVPKSISMEMSALPLVINPREKLPMVIKIKNPEQKPLKLRFKLGYQVNNVRIDEIKEFAFPSSVK